MSSEELEERLSRIKDVKLAMEARRFLLNLFLLFDGEPPAHIRQHINEIVDILEDENLARRIFF